MPTLATRSPSTRSIASSLGSLECVLTFNGETASSQQPQSKGGTLRKIFLRKKKKNFVRVSLPLLNPRPYDLLNRCVSGR